MANEIGRISGPLLSANLQRNGIDLAFETDLLYLKIPQQVQGSSPFEDGDPNYGHSINTLGVGINTDNPVYIFDVNNTIRTTNIKVDTGLDVADLSFLLNRIQNATGTIYITPDQLSDPTISSTTFQTANLSLTENKIENYTNSFTTDDDINFSPTGKVQINTDTVHVYGNLHATGDITFDGSITIGDTDEDSVTFESDINSHLIPNTTDQYDLGTYNKKWKSSYTSNAYATELNVDLGLIVNNNDVLTTAGKTIYVSVNGNDTLSSGSTNYVGEYNNAVLYSLGDVVSYVELGTTYYFKRISDPFTIGQPPTNPGKWSPTIVTSNTGTHCRSPFRTIKHALSQASFGDEIVIFPGTYTEIFPLTVPAGVTVRGTSIRSVAIQPTVGTNTNDCFLLNGDTTVQFLTVQNFYQGYAFKLAPNFKTQSRSPYLYNISVLTKGSVTSAEDPLGYNSADAGGGAFIDGSVADPTGTLPPTCLCFSVTMIVPNADGIVATNGSRIEWLNSFTYFAKRGIYLFEGTLGRASQGTVFGAEMRSINSANVYGEFGAVADGPHTLGYLIGHNFGYIGTGANAENDVSLVIQANEILTENDGQLYYDSKDHKGDFRIGDIFYINQETGNVVFDARAIDFGPEGSISLEGPTSATYINKDYVQTGNLRIHDNNIDSLSGPVNLLASSNKTYLNTDVYITGKMDITGNGKVSGNVYLGDQPLDAITIFPKLTQDINPKTTNFYNLGSSAKRWETLYAGLIDVDGVTQINLNTITTLTSNTDLKLIANTTGIIQVVTTDVEIDNDLTVDGLFTTNYSEVTTTTTSNTFETTDISITDNTITTIGTDHNLRLLATGIISIPDNDVEITNDLTVNDLTTLTTTNITGLVQLIGDYNLTGDKFQTGSAEITESSVFNGEAQFYDFNINDNTIKTIRTNSDVILGADGLGIVHVKTTNVTIENDLTVDGLFTTNYSEITTTATSNIFETTDISITDNTITTIGTNHDLQLLASTTGIISIPTNDVEITNDLTVNDLTTLTTTNITGLVQLVGDYNLTGDKFQTGSAEITESSVFNGEAQFYRFNINNNTLQTINSNGDLVLGANGLGIVHVKTTDVEIDNDLTVDGLFTTGYSEITTTATSNIFETSDISIVDNTITTIGTNHDLRLLATDIISIPTNDVEITNDLTVNDLTTLTTTNITGLVQLIGDYNLTGNKLQTGSAEITESSSFIGEAQFYDFNINDNTIKTTAIDGDFIISANGLGIVHVKTTDVEIDNDLTVDGLFTTNYSEVTTTLTSDIFKTSDISITDNIITTLGTNHDLRLLATGIISIPNNDVEITNKLTVNDLTTLTTTNITGLVQLAGNYNLTGNKLQTGSAEITANSSFDGEAQFYDFNINGDTIKTTALDSDFIIRANGTGIVHVKTTDVQIDNELTVTNNLTVNGTTNTKDVEIEGALSLTGNISQTGSTDIIGTFQNSNAITITGNSYFQASNIRLYNNTIVGQAIDTDVSLLANGSGGVVFDSNLKITTNEIKNVAVSPVTNLQKSIIMSPSGTGNVVVNSTNSLKLPIGNNTNRVLSSIGELRYNSTSNMVEAWKPSGYVNFMNLWDSDRNTSITAELTPGANDNTLRFTINGTVRATISPTALSTPTYHISNVSLTDNIISDVVNSNDLTINSSGSGSVDINGIRIKDSTLTNTTNGALILQSTGAGYVKFGGTAGVVIPFGPTEDRRLNPETGELRRNTTLDTMEVYNGTEWIFASGSSPTVSASEAEDIMNLWSFVLG